MARSSYKCKIDLSFVLDNESTEIDSQFLKYIIIENSYETRSMPVIYLSLALNNDIYTKLIENEKKAKIYFCLWKYNINSGSSIYKKDIEGQFTYIRPKSDPNYTQDLYYTNILYEPTVINLKVNILIDSYLFNIYPVNSVDTNINISWGDGIAEEIKSNSENSHTYELAGNYIINIKSLKTINDM